MTARVASIFAALGDPVRSTIVDRLAMGDATVGEIAGLFTISFQAVSQQIGTLERAGLVSRHSEGRTRRVHLEAAPLDQATQWMAARRLRLEERYRRLDEVLAEAQAEQPSPDVSAPGPASSPTARPNASAAPPASSIQRRDRP